MKKTTLLLLLASLTLVGCKFGSGKNQSSEEKKEKYVDVLPTQTESGVILHAFGWSFNQIKESLPSIVDAGYKAVQTMPVQQPKSGGADWTFFYQPVSFSVANSSPIGNKQDLTDLCTEAEKVGVDIIVDIVFNHLATNGGKDDAGYPVVDEEVDQYEHYIYANQNECFHHNKTATGSGAITQYYPYGNLPDLNTANSHVQERAYSLLKECIDCGVDGFRFDAAKHIETSKDPDYPSDFWDNTLVKAQKYYRDLHNRELYAYGEILNEVGGNRELSYYTDMMHVTDNSYIGGISTAVLTSKQGQKAVDTAYSRDTDVKNLVTWVESHDTYADEDAHTGNKKLMRMWAIVAGRKDATNLFFARPREGVSKIPMGEIGSTDYEDEHFAVVNRFHNRFIGANEYQNAQNTNFYINERYSDKDAGAIIVDLALKGKGDFSFTHLKDGTYYDQITAKEVVISGGHAHIDFDSVGVAVLTDTNNKIRPTITVDKKSQKYVSSIAVNISITNATTMSYQIDNGNEVSFTDKVKVTIGSSAKAGDKTVLKVNYSNGEYSTSRTYTYEKLEVIEGKFNVLNLNEAYLTDYELYIWSWSPSRYSRDYTWNADKHILIIDKASTYTGFLLVIFEKGKAPAKNDEWSAPLKQTGDIDPSAGFFDATYFQEVKTMKGKIILTGLLSLTMLLAVGCTGKGTKQTSEENSQSESQTPVEVVSEFTKGDDSHLKQEAKPTEAVRFHYRRKDNDGTYACYKKWQIWAWDISNGGNGAAYTFDHYDDFGVYVDVNKEDVSGGKTMNVIGFIVAITSDWTKDFDGDRNVEVPLTCPGGIYDVYVLTKTEKVYYDPESPLKNSLETVILDANDRRVINATFNVGEQGFSFDKSKMFVEVAGQKVTNFTVGDISASHRVSLTFTEKVDWTKSIMVCYQFDESWTDKVGLKIANYFDSAEFKTDYTYEGNDLGVTFDDESGPTRTTFKVWAPTSSSMILNIYNSSDYRTQTEPDNTYDMVLGEKGVWSYTVNADLSGKYYTYKVTNSLGTHEVTDPYAKSAGLNGRRGMITNFTKINQQVENWDSDTRPDYGNSTTDGVIYEAHVRDMTINPNSGVSAEHRGKFLGLAETGTKYQGVSTGLDHMVELGITHVQLQPFFDYASVDESKDTTVMSDENYNWGYDPQNYNALEGSYSTNPVDGANRIVEFKKMVMAMHKAGLNINMDVVYNHTASSEASNFNYLVPNYYYRTTGRGVFYNGSGCGNEFACDRSMGRKFVVESCKFWIDEYHLSGFRFDLMGLMDNQTMIDIYNDCHALYSNIMIYGEPWTGGSSKLESGTSASNLGKQQTVQGSLNQTYFAGNNVLVGAFNDQIRNAVRGDNGPGIGLVQGDVNSAYMGPLSAGMRGMFRTSESRISPQQVLNYVSCHDNYTLYDQLIQTNRNNRDFKAMYLQAEATVLFSLGVPFMQEGEEFYRSKAYDDNGKTKYSGNSYNVGDNINNMDYSLKVDNADVFNAFKEMIELRKTYGELRLSTREDINSKVYNTFTNANEGYARFSIRGLNDGSDMTVVHAFKNYTLKGLSGTIIYSNINSGATPIDGDISMQANETIIILHD